MRQLHDRVAVVTGAAGGIGRATSELLARKGCDLALVDLNREGLQETADLVGATGRRSSIHVADVADKARMAALPDEIAAEHGQIHILVNNAGVSVTDILEEQTLEDFEWIVGINFWGVVYGCKFFLPHLRQAEEAHIVNLSSMFGLIGLPSQVSYCATKFAVRGLSEALWVELADTPIGVTSVHPGLIRTSIVRSSRMSDIDEKQRIMDVFEARGRSPEFTAEKIVRAIEKDQLRVAVGREAIITDWAKRLFPVLTQRLVAWRYRRVRNRA
jgi:NAD(P)-dependent dehydrogenase (short-subunit alcohol dehydrogenase family)